MLTGINRSVNRGLWGLWLVLLVLTLGRQIWAFQTLYGARNELFEAVFRGGPLLLGGLICALVPREFSGRFRAAWLWVAACVEFRAWRNHLEFIAICGWRSGLPFDCGCALHSFDAVAGGWFVLFALHTVLSFASVAVEFGCQHHRDGAGRVRLVFCARASVVASCVSRWDWCASDRGNQLPNL